MVFNAFRRQAITPFQTRNTEFHLTDLHGRSIGRIAADIVDGRAFTTELPGIDVPVYRMGGLAPARGGSGLFEGAEGLITVDSWLSIFPSFISSVFVLRLADTDGKLRRGLAAVWEGGR